MTGYRSKPTNEYMQFADTQYFKKPLLYTKLKGNSNCTLFLRL